MVAAQFDHWDSRTGDPQLHTPVTVANRVQGEDGAGEPSIPGVVRAAVAFSETYKALLADEVTRRTGLTWDRRDRKKDRRPAREVAAVPDALITEFSERSKAIDTVAADLIEEYRRRHGHAPPTRPRWRRSGNTPPSPPDPARTPATSPTPPKGWRHRAEDGSRHRLRPLGHDSNCDGLRCGAKPVLGSVRPRSTSADVWSAGRRRW